MRIRDVMTTSPACCIPNDTVIRAARLMKEMDIGIVPVVESDRSRRLVGAVTDRDLCVGVVAEGQDPKTVQVQSCMTAHLVSCQPEDPVETAIALMREHLIRRVLVVDRQGIIQGVVSMADIVRNSDLPSADIHDTLKQISEPTTAASRPREAEGYREPT